MCVFREGTVTVNGFYASANGPPGVGSARCSRCRVCESLPEGAELTQ